MSYLKLFIFTLVLLSANPLIGQNTRTVEVDDDESSIYIEYEDIELTTLKIDGIVIPKEKHKDYQDIIDKYKREDRGSKPHKIKEEAESRKQKYLQQIEYDKKHNVSRDENDYLAKSFEELLDKEDLLFDPSRYSLKLTNNKLIVNGNKMPLEPRTKLARLANTIVDVNTNDIYEINIKMKKGSRSISVSIEN